MQDPMMKLTVKLKDGRTLAGTYNWIGALQRLKFASELPHFMDFKIEAA